MGAGFVAFSSVEQASKAVSFLFFYFFFFVPFDFYPFFCLSIVSCIPY